MFWLVFRMILIKETSLNLGVCYFNILVSTLWLFTRPLGVKLESIVYDFPKPSIREFGESHEFILVASIPNLQFSLFSMATVKGRFQKSF